MLKFGVIQFPGSNCDQDCLAAINVSMACGNMFGIRKLRSAVLMRSFLPGDLPTGIFALRRNPRFSPLCRPFVSDAPLRQLVLGTCNGFQIFMRSGLLPASRAQTLGCALFANGDDSREVGDSRLRVVVRRERFCGYYCPWGGLLFRGQKTLRELNEHRQVILRYTNERGQMRRSQSHGSVETLRYLQS